MIHGLERGPLPSCAPAHAVLRAPRGALFVLSWALVAACSSAASSPDAGPSGLGASDAGARDGGGSGARDGAAGDGGSIGTGGPTGDAGLVLDRDAGPRPGVDLDIHLTLEEEAESGLPGCYRCSLATADLDGDGRPDLIMAGAFDRAWGPNMAAYTFENVIRVYRNVSERGSKIAFQLALEVPGVRGGGGAIVRIGDFDGDARPDFAVQFREGVSPYSDTAGYLNQGGFVFTREVLAAGFDTNSTSLGMAVADVDGDGRDDLVFNSDGQLSGPGLWYKYDPSTSTWAGMQTDFMHRISYGGTIAAGDLDGDGYAELIVGGNSSFPFGHYDCAAERIYGELHLNRGRASPGIDPDGAIPLETFSLRHDPEHPRRCAGMDNADVIMADVDGDGHLDVVIAGSTDAFEGPPGGNATHYDFVVLRNVDGTGRHFVTFEARGAQLPGGTTNAGSANVDLPSVTVGDLNGDGWPEVFMQGHHRDYEHDAGAYVFDTKLFVNLGGTTFEEVDAALPDCGEGGQVMADFDGDGKVDLIYAGATLPFHSNGSNPIDRNDRSTIFTWVYRNVRP